VTCRPDAGTCDSVSHVDDVVMGSCDRTSRKSRGSVSRNDFTSARVATGRCRFLGAIPVHLRKDDTIELQLQHKERAKLS
jgi:hypothetical protein